jgi:hypothetical protein
MEMQEPFQEDGHGCDAAENNEPHEWSAFLHKIQHAESLPIQSYYSFFKTKTLPT